MDKILGTIATVVAALFLVAVLLGFPTMWLWDWIMPTLFGLKKITFWQAIGLNLLCAILFSNKTSK